MTVNTVWRGPGNTHAFVLHGRPYRLRLAIDQTPNKVYRFQCEDINVNLMCVHSRAVGGALPQILVK